MGVERIEGEARQGSLKVNRVRNSAQNRSGNSNMGGYRNNAGKHGSNDQAVSSTGTPGTTPGSLGRNGAKQGHLDRDAKAGKTISVPLSEVGKASRFGDRTLEHKACNVFEVVMQRRETTMCPACTRSPRRAQLPAHARGCFGLS